MLCASYGPPGIISAPSTEIMLASLSLALFPLDFSWPKNENNATVINGPLISISAHKNLLFELEFTSKRERKSREMKNSRPLMQFLIWPASLFEYQVHKNLLSTFNSHQYRTANFQTEKPKIISLAAVLIRTSCLLFRNVLKENLHKNLMNQLTYHCKSSSTFAHKLARAPSAATGTIVVSLNQVKVSGRGGRLFPY